MRICLSWLREHTPLEATVDQIVGALVRLGHEVEAVETPRKNLERVLVGQIVSIRPHPRADRLRLLQVDVGQKDLIPIVCGASNMKPGDRVPLALSGATLPGRIRIKPTKIRGEPSMGMCCSAAELGLGEDASGLMILPEDAPIGSPVGEYFELEEAIFVLSITPNRGDCMSVRGIARELAAEFGLPLHAVERPQVASSASVDRPVADCEEPKACPLYLCRKIEGIRMGPTPKKICRRLIDAGLRPVNGVVDILNYVMLDLGQPMHAFDAARVDGKLRIRAAHQGEQMQGLDGKPYRFNGGELIISDARGPLALAGILGSEDSGVRDDTERVILESAWFSPATISLTRRQHAIVSDASMRFERGVDPNMVSLAMEVATRMIIDCFGGQAGEVTRLGSEDDLVRPRELSFPSSLIPKRIGMPIDSRADAVLERMGFTIRRQDERMEVLVPSHRLDVNIPEDMAEEYARVIGYDAIPSRLPTMPVSPYERHPSHLAKAVAAGFHQVVTYAFIGREEQRLFVPDDGEDVALANPISASMAVMRRSLLPGLLKTAQYNLNRQRESLRLVEQGRVYTWHGDAVKEEEKLAWLMAGLAQEAHWYSPQRAVDFFDIKGAVEDWLAGLGIDAHLVADDAIPGLQQGQSAHVFIRGEAVGILGKVNDVVAERFGLDVPTYVAEIDLQRLPVPKVARHRPLPEFPSIRRDLVFLIDRDVPAAEVLETVTEAGDQLLVGARIFDRYVGPNVPEGKISLGVRCTFQSAQRTLTQDEVDRCCETIIAAVQKRFGAVLRA